MTVWKYSNRCVTPAVYEEVTAHNKPGADRLTKYLDGKVVDPQTTHRIIGGDSLDRGEFTSILLYKDLHANYLLIDEKAGRRVAKLNHVNIIGSLGVLIEAKRQNLIPQLRPHIDILRQSKIHFSTELLAYALTVVGE